VVNRKGAPLSLQARALRWLSQREYSRKELRTRLLRAADAAAKLGRADRAAPTALIALTAAEIGEGASPEAIDQDIDDGAIDEAAIDALLDHLQTRGLLSDERFAESRIRLRARRFGNQRIVGELKQHGLSLEPDAARELAVSEPIRATQAWQCRFGKSAAHGLVLAPAERARQERFLIGRGFPPDLARRVVAAGASGELFAEESSVDGDDG
jgi:regulatory protein